MPLSAGVVRQGILDGYADGRKVYAGCCAGSATVTSSSGSLPTQPILCNATTSQVPVRMRARIQFFDPTVSIATACGTIGPTGYYIDPGRPYPGKTYPLVGYSFDLCMTQWTPTGSDVPTALFNPDNIETCDFGSTGLVFYYRGDAYSYYVANDGGLGSSPSTFDFSFFVKLTCYGGGTPDELMVYPSIRVNKNLNQKGNLTPVVLSGLDGGTPAFVPACAISEVNAGTGAKTVQTKIIAPAQTPPANSPPGITMNQLGCYDLFSKNPFRLHGYFPFKMDGTVQFWGVDPNTGNFRFYNYGYQQLIAEVLLEACP